MVAFQLEASDGNAIVSIGHMNPQADLQQKHLKAQQMIWSTLLSCGKKTRVGRTDQKKVKDFSEFTSV